MSNKSLTQNQVPKTMIKFTCPAKSLLVTPVFLSLHLHLPFLLTLPWTSFLNMQKTSHLMYLKIFFHIYLPPPTIISCQLLSLALPLRKSLIPKFWLYLLVEVVSIFYASSLSSSSVTPHRRAWHFLLQEYFSGLVVIFYVTYSSKNIVFFWLLWLSSLGSSFSFQQDSPCL